MTKLTSDVTIGSEKFCHPGDKMTRHSKVCKRFEDGLLPRNAMDGVSTFMKTHPYDIYHNALAGWPGYENLPDSVDEVEVVISDSLPRTIP